MDTLNIHHVIRHRLSRIETNNFQDKSGCSINGFRSFLFEQGMVRNLDDIESVINNDDTIQDYRGYPLSIVIKEFHNYPLSDEILRMKNVSFNFGNQYKPIHKLVSPEPHFIEEERNLIDNHFKYLGDKYKGDVEKWSSFQMDCEGHLVSLIRSSEIFFQFSNESIEHLSNFPHLRHLDISTSTTINQYVANLRLLSNLRKFHFTLVSQYVYPELFQDLGLFSNLISLKIHRHWGGFLVFIH